MTQRHFASDNNAGAHPAVLAALSAVNDGHVTGYGDDPYTERAVAAFRALLGEQAEVFFAFNGTGANVVALGAALRPHQAVICQAFAHLAVDECGAFEHVTGSKLIGVPAPNGKLTPALVEAQLGAIGNVHHVQPAAISISQSSEFGTVYTLDELRALGDVCKRHGLFFHVDGARIANATAALGVTLRELLLETGVDACTFGGTKNGLLFGEAIVFPKPHPALAVLQFEAILRDDLWLTSAAHANRMAQRLAAGIAGIPGVTLAYPVDANGVFVQLPPAAIAPLQAERHFYVWDASASVVRWMCSFDTTEDDVDTFVAAVKRICAPQAAVAGAAR
jgi:threonine aldolase